MAFRYDAETERILRGIPQAEIEKFQRQEATADSWHELVFTMNLGLRLAERHIAEPEVTDRLCEALSALCDISDRFKRIKKWGANEKELSAIRDGLALTSTVRDLTTRREQYEAGREIHTLTNKERK